MLAEKLANAMLWLVVEKMVELAEDLRSWELVEDVHGQDAPMLEVPAQGISFLQRGSKLSMSISRE